MSDVVIDLDQIAGLPGYLRGQQSALTGASTLPSPDTGTTTSATRAAIDHVTGLATAFADDVGALAHGLDMVLDVYEATDGRADFQLSLYGKWIYE